MPRRPAACPAYLRPYLEWLSAQDSRIPTNAFDILSENWAAFARAFPPPPPRPRRVAPVQERLARVVSQLEDELASGGGGLDEEVRAVFARASAQVRLLAAPPPPDAPAAASDDDGKADSDQSGGAEVDDEATYEELRAFLGPHERSDVLAILRRARGVAG
jgi:AcrR family transcriptional regulator